MIVTAALAQFKCLALVKIHSLALISLSLRSEIFFIIFTALSIINNMKKKSPVKSSHYKQYSVNWLNFVRDLTMQNLLGEQIHDLNPCEPWNVASKVSVKGVFTDSNNNLFLMTQIIDTNKRSGFPKFQLIVQELFISNAWTGILYCSIDYVCSIKL